MAETQKARLYDRDKVAFDWTKYLQARPDVSENGFYDITWKYHSAHGGGWHQVYDVAAGPGNIAEILVSKFEKVSLSDPNPDALKFAKQRLCTTQLDEAKFEFKICKGEELEKHYPANSADMLVTAESISIMNHQAAIEQFAKVLKPGGTLAIWFYGGPRFTTSEDVKIERLFREITGKSLDQFKPYPNYWRDPCVTVFSWLDNVELPSADWTGIKRIKWNYDQQLYFEDEEDMGFKPAWDLKVGVDESVEKVVDRSFWAQQVDYEWCKLFIDMMVPRAQNWVTLEVEGMLEELRRIMGDGLHEVTWPAVLILATRKAA